MALPSFKTSRIKEKCKDMLCLGESPERISLAFSIGIFIAFSPTIGLHSISVVAFAYIFKLNMGALFIGAFVNNPWTMVPIYAGCLWFGMVLTGQEVSDAGIRWTEITFSNFLTVLEPYLLSFVIGTVILGTIAAFASYFLIKPMITRLQKEITPTEC